MYVALAQLGLYICVAALFVLLIFLKVTGQFTPTLNRIETLMVDKNLVDIIQSIKDGQR